MPRLSAAGAAGRNNAGCNWAAPRPGTAPPTHGHPTALAASDLTARAITDLRDGCAPAELAGRLRHYAMEQRTIWHGDWLGELWRRPGEVSPEAFIQRGWDECLAVLDRLDTAVTAGDRRSDPCSSTGAGWVAEEALATGLLCFLLFPDDPVAAVRRGGDDLARLGLDRLPGGRLCRGDVRTRCVAGRLAATDRVPRPARPVAGAWEEA